MNRLKTCFFGLIWGLLMLTQALASQVEGVRLEDLANYGGTNSYDAKKALEKVREIGDQLYTGGLEKVHMISFREEAYTTGQSKVYPLVSFVEYEDEKFYFELFDIIENKYKMLDEVRFIERISLNQTRFKASVALVDRLLLLEDKNLDLKMVFPLGVGSFDEGVFNEGPSLLTPRFKTGFLSKNVAIEERDKPRYFAGKPFIRVLWGNEKKYTGIGFHAQPNLDRFIRAFDSHGCIRMQLDDLELFFHLVDSNPLTYIPITITYEIDSQVSHPFPKVESSYKRVQNVGSSSNPRYTIDRDYLVQTQSVRARPPVELLYDFPQDDYEEFFNYSTQTCKTKSFGDEPRDGWSDAFRSSLKFERCEPRKRRNRLYRWWVH